jgi:DNA replication factor GINS
VDLDELRSVRRTERESSTLQHLRDSFYTDVADYVESRKEAYRRQMAEADDPFEASEEVEHIKDEVETAAEVAEAIYERRVGKVVKMAAFAAADMSTEEEGLTAEERDLFDDLVDRIRGNRETVLATLAGDAPTPAGEDDADGGADADATPTDPAPDAGTRHEAPTAGGDPDSAPVPPGDPAAPADAARTDDAGVLSDAMGGAGAGAGRPDASSVPAEADGRDRDGEPAPAPGPEAGDADPRTGATGTTTEQSDAAPGDGREPATDRTTVWLRQDVGRVLGVDEREYDLASEDVVELPTTNAEPLIERGAAERID